MSAQPCASCAAPVDPLELFPAGLCLLCYADSLTGRRGRRMPTAAELVTMWGGQA